MDAPETAVQCKEGLAKKGGGRPRAKLGRQRSPTCLPGPGQPQCITALSPWWEPPTGGAAWAKPRGGWVSERCSSGPPSLRSAPPAPPQGMKGRCRRKAFQNPSKVRVLFSSEIHWLFLKRTNSTKFEHNINSIAIYRILRKAF